MRRRYFRMFTRMYRRLFPGSRPRIHLHAGFVRAHLIFDTDTYSQMLLIVERTQAIPLQQITPIVGGQDKSVVVVVESGRQLMTRHHALWSLSGW